MYYFSLKYCKKLILYQSEILKSEECIKGKMEFHKCYEVYLGLMNILPFV